ncbi:hypothetical protein CgunFtcFv8_023002 [Champsocephalus gunnari]|uniref:Uncharacterized protein n=1 Tax=Champsocephalus gunnari TaxID=52237 RepID=A0AAN8D925_CHAGU|nr:hypothetical protein CgunFtcFv8_023002 [Champsocephalus gunnari]
MVSPSDERRRGGSSVLPGTGEKRREYHTVEVKAGGPYRQDESIEIHTLTIGAGLFLHENHILYRMKQEGQTTFFTFSEGTIVTL